MEITTHPRILPASVVVVVLLLAGLSHHSVAAEQSMQGQHNTWLSHLVAYLAQKGVESNAESLMEDMRRQAETGDPTAYLYLGEFYRRNRVLAGRVVVNKDPVAAVNAYANVLATAARSVRRTSYDHIVASAKFKAKQLIAAHEISAADISKDAAAYFIEAPRPSAALGWDLSYQSMLDAKDHWLIGWLGADYRSPIEEALCEYKGTTILSSVLLELPAPHAGEHVAVWLGETPGQVEMFVFAEHELEQRGIMPGARYAAILQHVNNWEQMRPPAADARAVPGFGGFINIYQHNVGARQIKLVPQDFIASESDSATGTGPHFGRAYQLLFQDLLPSVRLE